MTVLTSTPRTTLTDAIPELSTPIFGLTLVDQNGVPITVFQTVTGTLYDVKTGQVINGRSNFDLSPYIVSGVLSWLASSADMAVFSTQKDYQEQHRLLIQWVWNGSTQRGAHEIDHYVQVMQKVPA